MFRAVQDCFNDFINGFTFNEIDRFDFHRTSSTALGMLSKEMDRSDKVSENLKEKMQCKLRTTCKPRATRATTTRSMLPVDMLDKFGEVSEIYDWRKRRAPTDGEAARAHDAHELSVPGAARATLDGAGHDGASAARQGGARERRAPAPGGAARGA
jgi:hypothetical protein